MTETDTDILPELAELDAAGFLLRPGEDQASYLSRLSVLKAKRREIEASLEADGVIRLFDDCEFRQENRIPPEIMDEAAAITRNLYQFSIDWAPGFFLSHNLGLLWGGCAISDPDEYFSVFLIRRDFAKKKRWFIYRRDELLAHELCHTARMPLNDLAYEEHFAYATAHSPFRRYIGNCFQTKSDALLFLLPVMLLLAAEIVRTFTPIYFSILPFWIFALTPPLLLLLRNQKQRNRYFRAVKALGAGGCRQPAAVLFRCVSREIREMAAFADHPEKLIQHIKDKAATEIRWRLILFRFFNNTNQESNDHDHPL